MTGLACEGPVALWSGREAKLKNLQLQQDCVWEAPLTAPDLTGGSSTRTCLLHAPALQSSSSIQHRNGPRAEQLHTRYVQHISCCPQQCRSCKLTRARARLAGHHKSQSPLPSSLHLHRPVPPVTHQAVFGGLRNWTDTNAVADGQSGKTEETC